MSEHTNAPAMHRETPSTSKATERRLWFGILGAPFAWTLHELVGVAVIGRRCVEEGALEGWQWATIIGVSVLALLIAAAAGLTALKIYRDHNTLPIQKAEGWGRVEFMAIAGVIISFVLAVNILMMGVQPAIVQPCMVTT